MQLSPMLSIDKDGEFYLLEVDELATVCYDNKVLVKLSPKTAAKLALVLAADYEEETSEVTRRTQRSSKT